MDVDTLLQQYGTYLRSTIGLRSRTIQAYMRYVSRFVLVTLSVETFLFSDVSPPALPAARAALLHLREFLCGQPDIQPELYIRLSDLEDEGLRRKLRQRRMLHNLQQAPHRPTTPAEEFKELWHRAGRAVGDARADQLLRPALVLGLLCGLRRSDILTATWQWIDWEAQTITIVDPKGGRPYQIPLLPLAADRLWLLCSCRDEDHTGRHIVQSPKSPGCKTNRTTLAQELGLLGVTPHSLRRGFATSLLNKGVPLTTVATALNHSSTETTFRHYCNPNQEDLRDALQNLDG